MTNEEKLYEIDKKPYIRFLRARALVRDRFFKSNNPFEILWLMITYAYRRINYGPGNGRIENDNPDRKIFRPVCWMCSRPLVMNRYPMQSLGHELVRLRGRDWRCPGENCGHIARYSTPPMSHFSRCPMCNGKGCRWCNDRGWLRV